MRLLTVTLAATLVLGGCASVQRLASYSSDGSLTFDGQIMVDGRQMSLSIHPRENALLVQKTMGDGVVGGAIEGLTFGLARGWKPDPRRIDLALADFVRPSGCTVAPVHEVGADDVSFEGFFTCPAGAGDLRALMAAQREALRRGEPLRR